ncbi:hypothetical protein FRB91_005074 [Serendipita sp. 411]|nr:hypothetical protein FRC15_011554 [Serendipita sp. 397]KAG8860013.1 hypothetical protein FRB91_005074 [Serendipita sp. 411]
MNILASIAAFAIVTIGALASSIEPEERQLPVGPGTFNITSIGVSGTGCPFGTVSYALNNQRTTVTLTFSNYYATAGPGIPISENRKNCQITLKVHVPHCYRFAIPTIDYYGYYQLDDKVKANLRASYYFAGQVQQVTAYRSMSGLKSAPHAVDWTSYSTSTPVFASITAKTRTVPDILTALIPMGNSRPLLTSTGGPAALQQHALPRPLDFSCSRFRATETEGEMSRELTTGSCTLGERMNLTSPGPLLFSLIAIFSEERLDYKDKRQRFVVSTLI